MSAIHQKAMLASVSISCWSARKLDKKVTDEVNTSHGANADVARVNKSLVSKAALAEIIELGNLARRTLYARTLPWADSGSRILSAMGHGATMAELTAIGHRFDTAVDTFVAGYADYVAQARLDMSGLFNADDYPSPEDIRTRFSFRKRIWPLPNAADFRIDIGDAERDRIKAEIESDFQDAIGDAVKDVYLRVADVVGAMADKLKAFAPSAKKGDKSTGIFRDSLVENVRTLCDLLPSLNITGDAGLTTIAKQLSDLAYHDAEELREDSKLRKEVADKAAAIASTVADYLA